jgi:hypothetical protein
MQFNRSKPGQPPKRDTGGLVRSIFASASRGELAATVGTTLKYGVALERGASIPARRPVRKKVMVFAGHPRIHLAVGGSIVSRAWDWIYTRYAEGFRLRKRPYIWATIGANRNKLAAVQWRPVRDYMRRSRN